jgi:predicted nucleic acid-binding Zn ribbon protein
MQDHPHPGIPIMPAHAEIPRPEVSAFACQLGRGGSQTTVTGSKCVICGTSVAWYHPQAVCSPSCYRELRNQRRRVQHTERPCAECGEPFTPARSDARTCSDRCRQRAHRAA